MKLLISCCLIIFLSLVSFFTFLCPLTTIEKEAKDQYEIDLKFDKVRKIIVRRNALQNIVSKQHGKIISQDWYNIDLQGLEEFNIMGRFSVHLQDVNVPECLEFMQAVSVKKDCLESKVWLIEPSGYLEDYFTCTKWQRREEKTIVNSQVKIVYKRRIPINYKEYAENQVTNAVIKSLEGSHESITILIEENKNKRIIIPNFKEWKND